MDIHTPSGVEAIAIHGGFIQVLNDEVSVLADAAERAEQIDLARAEAARERAQRRLEGRDVDLRGGLDVLRAQLALQRSLTRIRVARRRSATGAPSQRPEVARMPRTNHLGQPIGDPVPDWTPRPFPPHERMEGRLCRLEPLEAARHARSLHAAYAEDREGRMWTYLPYGPFAAAEEYEAWVAARTAAADPQFYAIVDIASDRPAGVASYLRIDPANGSIEVGHLAYSPALQRTPAATEAMYLMMRHAFGDLGYRRYEWKCDSHNSPSWRAAERLGFRYEGTFRQAVVMKGRNRDHAWLSIIDAEWPLVRAALEAWLAPSNFDAAGQQRRRLEEVRAGLAPSFGSPSGPPRSA
jgi:RimJ/RimL family protein N-acetyltransferase